MPPSLPATMTWDSLWEVVRWAVPVLATVTFFILNRREARATRENAKREAVREAAIKERETRMKKLEAAAAENVEQHRNFAMQLEALGSKLLAIEPECKDLGNRVLQHESKIDNTKETLGRVEGQLAQLLGLFLNRP